MDNLTRQAWRRAIKPDPDLNVWQWCADKVDFSLAPNYDTPKHERFDPSFMPFWNEPAEAITDPSISEVTILKCARAGGSENILLNPIRYCVANMPQPILYVTGDQISAERFMEKRIKRGFRACPDANRHYKKAQATQHDISFPGCDLRVTWPKARQAFKQDGWALVLCDEVSLWPDFSSDMARKRTASYPFSHIVFLSSPDPAQKRSSDDDPIFLEHARGDQRVWECPDPKTGSPFVFLMGGRDSFGLRWDQNAKTSDGRWDFDKVKASAHYITPDGTRIDNVDRMAIVRRGKWRATNQNAPANVRSYHVNAFMTPFKSGDFGEIACAFLQAKHRGASALRVFIYEYLAEKFSEHIERTPDEKLIALERDYNRGEKITEFLPEYHNAVNAIIIGADVQKTHIWWTARQFVDGGDSGLVEFGNVATFDELAGIADKLGANRVLIDAHYRQLEVFEACATFQFIPVEGRDNQSLPFVVKKIDPFEGTGSAGKQQIGLIQLQSDVFKSLLMDCMRGESEKKWWIPRGMPREYTRQITAEQKVDGRWELRRGYTQNHLFDCETYALVGAVYAKLFRTSFFQPIA